MIENYLAVLISMLIVGGGGSMLAALLFLRVTLTRRLKRHLKQRNRYWDSGTLDFDLVNTALFGWACVIPSMERWENFKKIYSDIGIKQFSRPVESAAAFFMIGGLAALLLGTVCVLITDIFGMIVW